MGHVFRAVVMAALSLALVVACASRKPEPAGTAPSVDDASITAAIKTALIKEKLGLVTEVRVITRQGRVELSGGVPSEREKQRIGAIARQVEGVREVVNALTVTPRE
jgi:hyperosmotically inducible periplasmic protein